MDLHELQAVSVLHVVQIYFNQLDRVQMNAHKKSKKGHSKG